MKRLVWLMLGMVSLGVAGCLGDASYDERMQRTLDNMRYQQKLDANLMSAPQEKFKALSVFVRPPKGLKQISSLLRPAPGTFEIVETFQGPPNLHVLVRKNPPPKPAPPKPGQPAPPPPAARGPFVSDVNTLLGQTFGAEPGKQESVTEHGKAYKRAKFTSAAGETVTVYYYEQGSSKNGYDAALVWVIPPKAAKTAPVVTGIPLTMGSFATGRGAANAFAGRAEDDMGGGGGEGGIPEGGGGVAF
jgi:hypothetical protein